MKLRFTHIVILVWAVVMWTIRFISSDASFLNFPIVWIVGVLVIILTATPGAIEDIKNRKSWGTNFRSRAYWKSEALTVASIAVMGITFISLAIPLF
jgi:hypothetical protein